jgi:hypothetical protein
MRILQERRDIEGWATAERTASQGKDPFRGLLEYLRATALF